MKHQNVIHSPSKVDETLYVGEDAKSRLLSDHSTRKGNVSRGINPFTSQARALANHLLRPLRVSTMAQF
jgi:hypothetical protein